MVSNKRNVGIFDAKEYPGPHRMRFTFTDAQESKQWQRMCQAFVMAFLTRRGSVPFAPDYGTTFVEGIFGGIVNSEVELKAAFTVSKIDVFYYLTTTGYFDRLGPGERLGDVVLRQWAYDYGHAEIWLDFYDSNGTKIVVAWVPVAPAEITS